ncbi:carboxylesterase, partial [Cyathus striatus]
VYGQRGITVHTQEGDVTGTLVLPTVRQFLGIPFATANRWEAPQPAPRRKSTFKANQFGSSCIQTLAPTTVSYLELTGQGGLDVTSSEDCLTVNIWAPSSERKQNTAVLLWIYGGGFSFGTSNLTIYHGDSLVRDQDDIILVTFNYRLNIFGQPNAPQLVSKTQSQNFGLLDLDAAVAWVHANIANFGGDPNRISIFGQSAGRIIEQSGTISGGATLVNTMFNASSWNTIAASVGCGTNENAAQLACMKKVPAQTLENAVLNSGITFGLVPDDITVFTDMQTRINNGNFLKVPLLGGTTQHEDDVFIVAQQLVAKGFTVPVITEIVSDSITQSGLTCPAGNAAIVRNNFNVPTWRYQYQAIFPDISVRPDLRCYHASDIPMVFGTFTDPFPNVSSTPTEVSLSKYMQSAWVSFARDPQKGLIEFGLVQLGNLANQTGAVFGLGSLLDSSCSNIGDLSTIINMLSPLLPS